VQRAEKKYEAEGLKVLWVGHQDKIPKLKAYAERNGINAFFGFDKDDSMSRKYGMTYGGGVVFMDRSHWVRVRIPKGFSPATLESSIQAILKSDGSPSKTP